ncbi:MAG TPA: HypC/HybG/HupF family hydrogenase formation chaperone [Acidimicrobiales bacterium]|nr:HypC/HybG/HupF family hydrogenase formation chaperone [Acidimicrobiales bacterium]
MCVSRLHRVLRDVDHGAVDVEDVDGTVHRVSLLALDGPPPVPGEWLVVHSGYAINRVDTAEAEAVAADLRSNPASEALVGRRGDEDRP